MTNLPLAEPTDLEVLAAQPTQRSGPSGLVGFVRAVVATVLLLIQGTWE
jgi:hypothetical protein